jgi:hypothetical protein
MALVELETETFKVLPLSVYAGCTRLMTADSLPFFSTSGCLIESKKASAKDFHILKEEMTWLIFVSNYSSHLSL